MIMHKKPIATKRLQAFYRRRMNIHRWHRIMIMHHNIKPIQRMGKAYLVKTMLKRMKEKEEALMQKVRKRMRADMDRILKMCMDLLRKHAVVTIEHRNKLGGFERLKTKKLLMKWHEVARGQVLHRIEAILVIQKCFCANIEYKHRRQHFF